MEKAERKVRMRVVGCGRICDSLFQVFFSVFNSTFPSCYLQARFARAVCEAEQRTDGICWLRGELAGATESRAEDLMTKGGSNPQAQPFSVPRRWPTSCTAVCSAWLFVLLLLGVWKGHGVVARSYLMSWAMCVLHCASGPLSLPGGLPTWAPGACSGRL